MPNKSNRTTNADAEFGLGPPMQGHEPKPRTRGLDFWERSDERGESAGYKIGSARARYRRIIGDAPRLGPDDREGAKKFLMKIEEALGTFSDREDGREGHWNRVEKNNLRRLRRTWKARAEGKDEWYRRNGNYTERKKAKEDRYSEETIEGLKGKWKEKRVRELLGETKKVWKRTGTHGVTGEPIYEWKEIIVKRGALTRDRAGEPARWDEVERQNRTAKKYRERARKEEEIKEIAERREAIEAVGKMVGEWEECLKGAEEKLRRLSEQRCRETLKGMRDGMMELRAWSDRALKHMTRRAEQAERPAGMAAPPIGATTRARD